MAAVPPLPVQPSASTQSLQETVAAAVAAAMAPFVRDLQGVKAHLTELLLTDKGLEGDWTADERNEGPERSGPYNLRSKAKK